MFFLICCCWLSSHFFQICLLLVRRNRRLLTRSSLADKKCAIEGQLNTPDPKRQMSIDAPDFTPEAKKQKVQSPKHEGQFC